MIIIHSSLCTVLRRRVSTFIVIIQAELVNNELFSTFNVYENRKNARKNNLLKKSTTRSTK